MIYFFFFLTFLPLVNVHGCPKKEAFAKASQPQLHHFCCVPALGWTLLVQKTRHTPLSRVQSWAWPLGDEDRTCSCFLALWVGC